MSLVVAPPLKENKSVPKESMIENRIWAADDEDPVEDVETGVLSFFGANAL